MPSNDKTTLTWYPCGERTTHQVRQDLRPQACSREPIPKFGQGPTRQRDLTHRWTLRPTSSLGLSPHSSLGLSPLSSLGLSPHSSLGPSHKRSPGLTWDLPQRQERTVSGLHCTRPSLNHMAPPTTSHPDDQSPTPLSNNQSETSLYKDRSWEPSIPRFHGVVAEQSRHHTPGSTPQFDGQALRCPSSLTGEIKFRKLHHLRRQFLDIPSRQQINAKQLR